MHAPPSACTGAHRPPTLNAAMGLRVREAQDGADGPGSGHHRAQPVPQVRGAVAADLLLEAAGHFLQGTNAGTDGEGECRGALAQAGSPQHAQHSKPPVSLLGQLYWREFFYLNGHTVPNFDRMEGNPICKQIPWRKDGDAETERLLEAWEEGRTGYPFIDAIMVGPATWGVGGFTRLPPSPPFAPQTQLREEGWMHHLARHAVACFLTRGDLWISWERGARVFDRHLLDADWSINNGNWMWLSASAFFYQVGRGLVLAVPALAASRAVPLSSSACTARSRSGRRRTRRAHSSDTTCPCWLECPPSTFTSRGRRPWPSSVRRGVSWARITPPRWWTTPW